MLRGTAQENITLTLLKTIKEQNNQILEWIRNQDRAGGFRNENTNVPEDIGILFPINTEQDLEILEDYLKIKANSTAFVSYNYII